MNIKTHVTVKSEGKEYPDLTREQLKELVKYLNQGFSEKEAKAKVLNK